MLKTFFLCCKLLLPVCLDSPSHSNYPSHLQISEVQVDGYKCYSTPFFEICPSNNNTLGKILYMPEARYQKDNSTLTFMLKINDSPIVSKLKEMKNNISRWNLSVCLIAEPESFYLYREADILSCLGESWDGYEECPVMYIKFPLLICMTENQKKYKNRNKYFKNLLKTSHFKNICIKCGKDCLEIPLEFPLNETINEMEKMFNNIQR